VLPTGLGQYQGTKVWRFLVKPAKDSRQVGLAIDTAFFVDLTVEMNGELQAELELVFAHLDERFPDQLFHPHELLVMLRLFALYDVGRDAEGAPILGRSDPPAVLRVSGGGVRLSAESTRDTLCLEAASDEPTTVGLRWGQFERALELSPALAPPNREDPCDPSSPEGVDVEACVEQLRGR